MSKADEELEPRPAASGSGSSAVPASGRGAGTLQGAASGDHQPETRRSRRATDAPVDAESGAPERISLARARDQEALRTYRALAEHSLPTSATSYDAMPTRRQLRLQEREAQAARLVGGSGATGSAAATDAGPTGTPPAPAGDTASDQSGEVQDLSVEQALAARQVIIGHAADQVAMIGGTKESDPFAVDPGILAQQRALAERAAVLNSRAQKVQQLPAETSQRSAQTSDPTTAHNLSIVAPPEYVVVQGVDQPVLKAPTTSHIPIIARPAAGTPGGPAARGSRMRAQAGAVAGNHGQSTGDSATPVRARSAHGLDPLDAMTAGLGRARRMKYLQFFILGLGVLALLTGILMIVSGFGG